MHNVQEDYRQAFISLRYIRENYSRLSRYEIDVDLLKWGYDAKNIEEAWQSFFLELQPSHFKPNSKLLRKGLLFLLLLVGLLSFFLWPKEPEQQIDIAQQINKAESKWLDLKIKSYRIEVHRGALPGDSWVTTVKNGQVAQATCDICQKRQYTVDDLFATARSTAVTKDWRKFEHITGEVEVQFDRTYGFPNFISFKTRDITDASWQLEVKSFEVITN